MSLFLFVVVFDFCLLPLRCPCSTSQAWLPGRTRPACRQPTWCCSQSSLELAKGYGLVAYGWPLASKVEPRGCRSSSGWFSNSSHSSAGGEILWMGSLYAGAWHLSRPPCPGSDICKHGQRYNSTRQDRGVSSKGSKENRFIILADLLWYRRNKMRKSATRFAPFTDIETPYEEPWVAFEISSH